MIEVPEQLDLSAPQARVLGCLIEKAATTPDAYPLTLKALTTACNQSTNRFPVVEYEATLVEATLHALKGKGLVRIVHPSHGERATKYRHVVDTALGLSAAQVAVLAVLFLRGAQTVSEIKTRTDRLHGFNSTHEVEQVLNELRTADRQVVELVERQPGQKEDRWIQVLEVDVEGRAAAQAPSSVGAGVSGRGSRLSQEDVDALTSRVEELEKRLSALESELS